MASAQVSPELPRPSFAKVGAPALPSHPLEPCALWLTSQFSCQVVASVAQEPLHAPHQTMHHTPSMKHDVASRAPVVVSSASVTAPRPQTSHLPKRPFPKRACQPSPGGSLTDVDRVTAPLQNLKIGPKIPNLVVDGSGTQRGLANKESGSDESQKCDSSSELGTKAASLDGKSITSGTTFAMDEKESLRPDDSASVKAAAEDDDAFSIRGSFIAGSRMSSDIAARARGIQLGDIPERRLAHPPPGPHAHGMLTPQSSSSEQPPVLSSAMPLSAEGSSDALNFAYRQAPDEKLLDALVSSKDRYFLLRLEKDVIDFVQDSKYIRRSPSTSTDQSC